MFSNELLASMSKEIFKYIILIFGISLNFQSIPEVTQKCHQRKLSFVIAMNILANCLIPITQFLTEFISISLYLIAFMKKVERQNSLSHFDLSLFHPKNCLQSHTLLRCMPIMIIPNLTSFNSNIYIIYYFRDLILRDFLTAYQLEDFSKT